jgi:hypothetical protein
MFELHVRTYEVDDEGKSTAVLEHVFFGETKAEAVGYAHSHEKSDSFFKTCGANAIGVGKKYRVWHGIKCWAEFWWTES